MRRLARPGVAAALLASSLLGARPSHAAPIPVRYPEGLIHGFLALRTVDGKVVATGDLLQSARGDTVTSRLLLRFKDGSTSAETTVYTQRRFFRLISDHLVQKGPAFKNPMDVAIDGKTGEVTVQYTDDGKEKTLTEKLDPLPENLANGLVGNVMKNVGAAPETRLPFVVATPKPRVVTLVITPRAKESFLIGGRRRKATHWLIKMELGGLAGVLAPLLGKDPPDSHLWLLGGEAPAFLMSEMPIAAGGPSLHMEVVSPFWPRAGGAEAAKR